ncbi:mycofactocin biosynthesis glycosyltransferase MftF [Actinocorallia longicatena]|uniref:Mycofactocin biosynthesis glycosyltransferase MftF n=1 Tax=Actinocorallia longicatena TaxID=111803 RepID=A0ABP6Q6K4_9ACTN
MTPVVIDRRVAFRSGGRVAMGGAPWKVVRFADAALPFLGELRRAGEAGVVPVSPVERAVARRLLDQGLAHPGPAPRPGPHPVTVVVPAYGRADRLRRCLASLGGLPVIVVDDASPDPGPVRAAAEAHGARLVRHRVNRGPAAARNTGLRLAGTPFVAFVDSDCRVEPGWLDALMPCLDDPGTAAAAPRVVPAPGGPRILARYERTRSALDMGGAPALVRPGARLSFVPSATLLVRRETVAALGFDEALRLGEDVDLVWRLSDAGHHVRFRPAARVAHDPRPTWREWAVRRHEYGTSAAELAARHPGRLAPVRPSPWNLAALALLVSGRPAAAAATAAVSAALLARGMGHLPGHRALSATIVAQGVAADPAALGHALRREWWPLGLVCLAAAPRRRAARAAAAAMLLPIAAEWLRAPSLDPVRYTAVRLADDLAYGTGVWASALRHRTAAPLLPLLRRPKARRT